MIKDEYELPEFIAQLRGHAHLLSLGTLTDRARIHEQTHFDRLLNDFEFSDHPKPAGTVRLSYKARERIESGRRIKKMGAI